MTGTFGSNLPAIADRFLRLDKLLRCLAVLNGSWAFGQAALHETAAGTNGTISTIQLFLWTNYHRLEIVDVGEAPSIVLVWVLLILS